MEYKTSRRCASLWLALILLLGLGIRLAGLYWGQGYCTIGPSDALEAYSVAVDYGLGDARAEYLGQPNYNSHAKLPGPLWTLFCFAGMRLWGSVEGVVLGLILVNTAAIYVTYLLTARVLEPCSVRPSGGPKPRAGGSPSPPLEERAGERRPNPLPAAAFGSDIPEGGRMNRPGELAGNEGLLSLSSKGGEGNGVASTESRDACKEQLRPPAALWAALFAATLPFAIYYSVSIYNPNVMAFLGGLLFLALWDTIRRERSRNVVWLGFLLLVMPQFHMCVTMLLPALIVILVLAAPRLNLRWLFGGLLAGALLYVPYLRGELGHGWQNTLGMMSTRSGYSWGGLKALTAPLSLLTNWVPQWTASTAEYRQLGKACFGWFGIFLALNLLSGLVALLLAGRTVLDLRTAMSGFSRAPRAVFNRAPGPLFLAILVVVPLLCAAVSGKNFRTHYSLVLFPALLALAGGAVARWSAAPRVGRWVVTAVVLVTGGNVWFMPAMFHDQSVRIASDDVFVGSFRNLEGVYQRLKESAGANRSVKVDDEAYFRGYSRQDRDHLDAKFIRRYVAIREKEAGPRAAEPGAAVTYRLCRSAEVSPNDPRVAYRAHGIALIRVGSD